MCKKIPSSYPKASVINEKLSWKSLVSFRGQDQETKTEYKLQILNSMAFFRNPVTGGVQGEFWAWAHAQKLVWFDIQHPRKHPSSKCPHELPVVSLGSVCI